MKKVIKLVAVIVCIVCMMNTLIYGQVQPERRYHLIDLGTFDNSGINVQTINNKGEVIGHYNTANRDLRSFIYSRGSMKDIGTFCCGSDNTIALGINDKSEIVGFARHPISGFFTAFLYSEGSMQYVGMLSELDCKPSSLNNYGDIAGQFLPQGAQYNHAFLYQAGNFTDLGTLGGITSEANAINNKGQVVGFAWLEIPGYHAFLYSDGSMRDLGTFGGKLSKAYDINDHGHVVGEAQLPNNGPMHAFLYSDGTMKDLGVLIGDHSGARGINDNGEVVGSSQIIGSVTRQAFLYSNGAMKDLNDLLIVKNSGWIIGTAKAINNNGQIIGTAVNSSGQYREVLLNPVPFDESLTAIKVEPTQPVYGNVLIKEDGKDSLVVVTHGRIPTGDDPNVSTAWVNTMTTAIADYLNSQNINNWQVFGYMWIKEAQEDVLDIIENAKQQGVKLGRQIVSQGYTNVHFIAHSAGAALIQSATDVIKTNDSSIVVHETFLDPFVGADFSGTSTYGKSANWADNYSSNDHDTRNEYVPFTYNILTHSYNVDVTQLDLENRKQIPLWVTENATPCYVTRSTHDWPIQFYLNTIIGDTTSEYEGFGFGLSEIGGNWNYALSQYKVGNDSPGHILGIPDPSDCRFSLPAPSLFTTLLNVFTAPTLQSDTGTIEKTSESSVTLSTGSPVWLAAIVTVTNPVNTIAFDAQFSSLSGAQGLLSVLWNDNVIGTIDERVITSNSFTFRFPNAVLGSSHFLGFRLDPFTNIQSVVSITNITLQQIGVSEPFSLSFTGTTTNGVRIQELTGEPGFEYYVQSSTNLLDWVDFAVLVNMNGTVRFYDQSLTNGQTKFYRAIAP